MIELEQGGPSTSSSPHAQIKEERKSKVDVFARFENSSKGGRGQDIGWARYDSLFVSSFSFFFGRHVILLCLHIQHQHRHELKLLYYDMLYTHRCPLCPKKSKKRYAFGRGISSHLHAVHTPWNLSKSAINNKERQLKNKEWMKKMANADAHENPENDNNINSINKNTIYFTQEENSILKYCSWEPTAEEVKQWGLKVVELTALVETPEYNKDENDATFNKDKSTDNNIVMKSIIKSGYDRTGKKAISYHDSLSSFHKSAANGELNNLKRIIEESSNTEIITESEKDDNIKSILYSKDRNGAIAEHWAAGGGHAHCLEYLLMLNKKHPLNNNNEDKISKVKRRDGKTSLHYAARNGHINCIELLLQQQQQQESSKYYKQVVLLVDEPSGDGTTPLHMACYGGKFNSIKCLIEQYYANPSYENDWGCNASHWIAMSINTNRDEVIQACEYLYNACQLSFHTVQKQGHTSLHKAAQRKNVHVIQWLGTVLKNNDYEQKQIGMEDVGGNKPSDILENVGGDSEVVQWMRLEFGW